MGAALTYSMPPPEPHEGVFIVIGDSRSGFGNEDFEMTENIINDAIDYTLVNYGVIDGIIMTGDYVNSGKNDDEWILWYEANENAFDYPVYPNIGNHDDERLSCNLLEPLGEIGDFFCYFFKYPTTNYYQVFQKPDWYFVDIGPIHLVSISSNFEGELLDIWQWVWLSDDLLFQNTKKWTFVNFHAPAYASYTWFQEGHGSDENMQDKYVPLLHLAGVDLVINGHNHWYERLEDDEGLTHVTVGGGGAPLLPVSLLPNDRHEFSIENKFGYGYAILLVDNETMSMEAIRYDSHDKMDYFEIIK